MVSQEVVLSNPEEHLLYNARCEVFSKIIYSKVIGEPQSYKLSFLRKNKKLQKEISLDDESMNFVINQYSKWLNQKVFLAFKDEKENFCFWLAAKRGNSVYKNIVKKRILEATNFMNHISFRGKMLRIKKQSREKISNVAFITLTCNPKKYFNNRVYAWLNFEHDYNIFITRLRKEFKNVWVMKSVESTEKGFPHIHLLVITDKPFSYVFKKYSVQEKKEIYRTEDKKVIENFWPSFVDVRIPPISKECKGNYNSAIVDYIFKDMLKSLEPKNYREKKNKLTLALGWLFGKQSISISRNKLLYLIIPSSVTQTQIKEIKQKKDLTFLGFINFKSKNSKPPPNYFEISKTDELYNKISNVIYGIKPKPKLIEKKINVEVVELGFKFFRLNLNIRNFETHDKAAAIIRKSSRCLDNKIKLTYSERIDLAVKGVC